MSRVTSFLRANGAEDHLRHDGKYADLAHPWSLIEILDSDQLAETEPSLKQTFMAQNPSYPGRVAYSLLANADNGDYMSIVRDNRARMFNKNARAEVTALILPVESFDREAAIQTGRSWAAQQIGHLLNNG